MTSISNDQIDAGRALAARLREWQVPDAEQRATQFIADMVARGWAMSANVRPIRRPPMPSEECPEHIGEWADFCRACAAERKAQRDAETSATTERWTPEMCRDAIHAPSDRPPPHTPLTEAAADAAEADTNQTTAAREALRKEDAT